MVTLSSSYSQIPSFRGIVMLLLGLIPIIQLKLASYNRQLASFSWQVPSKCLVFDLTMSFLFAVLHIFYVLDPLQLEPCACIFSIFPSVMILCQKSRSLSSCVIATCHSYSKITMCKLPVPLSRNCRQDIYEIGTRLRLFSCNGFEFVVTKCTRQNEV